MNNEEIEEFHDLKVWQDGHDIALEIYEVTNDFPEEEKFGLVSQMRRCASSITANIAEGFGRYYYKEKIRFYRQARGSVSELQDHLFLSQDLKFLEKEKARELFSRLKSVGKQLNGLIKSLDQKT